MFDLLTSYENAPACKPSRDYYAWIARTLSVRPETCLMVGDDAALDMAAAESGMQTFLVSAQSDDLSHRGGDLAGLRTLLGSMA